MPDSQSPSRFDPLIAEVEEVLISRADTVFPGLDHIVYCHVCGNAITHGHMKGCAWATLKGQLSSVASEKQAPESRWVPTIDRQPDVDGRLWAILTTRMDDGRHTGYIPLYEYYHFDNGWATDDTVTHWLDCPLHPFPRAKK